MTRQKSFKTRVRARMDKTGESYTAARRQLIDKTTAPPAEPATGAKPLELSDALPERTGRERDEWFALLDDWQATTRTHTEIARWLITEHAVPGWWAQSITVAYEQARGLRAPGQGRDGFFSVNASKTIAVPVTRLFDAFADPRLRQRWLPDVTLAVRTATAPKSFRADWAEGTTRLVAGFDAKGEHKATVAVSHEKVTDAATAAELKQFWRDRLGDLKRLLEA